MTALAPILVWFRNDLRLDDHEPMVRAVASGAPVVPVFCVDPRQFGVLPSGVPKTGAFRAQFLIESLADLRASCRERGGDLVVRVGLPEIELPRLANEVGARQVFVHEEVASEETTIEVEVGAALATVGATLKGWWGHTLLHPDDLPFDIDVLPDLFTKFRTLVERDVDVRVPFDAPKAFQMVVTEVGALPTLQSLGLEKYAPDARALFTPRGGERAANERLAEYVWTSDSLRDYKHTRNGMLRVNDSSKFSPWLAMGCLSPRRVWEEVQRYERERIKNESTYWLFFELLWRDYFRFLLAQHGDAIFALRGLHATELRWRQPTEPTAAADLHRWQTGTTGFPLMDAAMRELSATGYTSNRARQNVASFLTKNLRIDWRVGAEWFESLLVDYDVASNWGNWAYSAGVGSDARGFRFFNLHKQSADYDPHGDFIRHWIPELDSVPGGAVHRPELLTRDQQARFGVALGGNYPHPMVDLFASANASQALYDAVRGTSAKPNRR